MNANANVANTANAVSAALTTPPPESSWIQSITYHPSTTDAGTGILVVVPREGSSAYLYLVPSWLPGLVLAGVYSDNLERRSVGRAYVKRVKGQYPAQVVDRDEAIRLVAALPVSKES